MSATPRCTSSASHLSFVSSFAYTIYVISQDFQGLKHQASFTKLVPGKMEGSGDTEDRAEVLPSTESDAPANTATTVTDEQWRAMKGVIENLLAFREEE